MKISLIVMLLTT